MVLRDPKELKFDPNQPRKDISEEAVESLAQTYDSQDIINEPEIDEEDIIITGEMRVRAAIKKGLDKIKCKLITGLSEDERFERQVIENLHHNVLSDKEKENAIRKLWDSEKYTDKAELASRIGMSTLHTKRILNLKEQRENLGITKDLSISSATLIHISSLTIEEQKGFIAKINANQLKQGAELRELAVEIKKLPNDLKKAVLTIENPIALKMAKTIAQFTDKEQRTEMISEVISIDKMKEETVQYHLDIATGKIPKKRILVEDPMKLRMKRLLDIKFKIFNNFDKKYLDVIDNLEYRQRAYTIMREIYDFIRKQLEQINDVSIRKVIEIKGT